MPLYGEKYYTLIAAVRRASPAINQRNPYKGQVYFPFRSFSTKAGVPFSPPLVLTNVKKYENPDLDKLGIISENKGKCGIYR